MNPSVKGICRVSGSAKRLQAASARERTARWAAPLGLLLLSSCGSLVADKTSIGGETHFLITCGEDCGPSLSCIEGVCTRLCQPGFSTCSELGNQAACVSAASNETGQTSAQGTCDVPCTADADCGALGASHTCRAGACRADPDQALSSVLQPQTVLAHAVDANTCLSGLRWVGGDSASAEMQPGSDCVGCHEENGARQLLFGGTVYGEGDGNAPPPLDGCFGVEGVEVIVTETDGRTLSAVTNRAGNFYFEGSPSELALPYTAAVHWHDNRGDSIANMFVEPSYGGCASCHIGNSSSPTTLMSAQVIFLPGLNQ